MVKCWFIGGKYMIYDGDGQVMPFHGTFDDQ